MQRSRLMTLAKPSLAAICGGLAQGGHLILLANFGGHPSLVLGLRWLAMQALSSLQLVTSTRVMGVLTSRRLS